MKKIVLSLCLLLTIAADASKIHWLIFVDTSTNVAELDKVGHDVLHNHFVNEINAALAPAGYSANIMDFIGTRTTPENCKAAVEMLRVDAEDIIVFYYIGHGGRPNISDTEYLKKNPWPQMCMAQWDERRFIPLKWVNDQLSAKGARLSIVIGMCCNSLSNEIRVKEAPSFAVNYGATYMSGNKLRQIQDLFLNYKGNLLCTSASPTETSIGAQTPYGDMDYYTAVLCNIFEYKLEEEKLMGWNKFMTLVGNTVSALAHRTIDSDTGKPCEQNPIFDDSRLFAINAPQPTEPVRPAPQQEPQPSDNEDWKNVLSEYLDAIINTSYSLIERRSLENKISQMFAPGAIVRMMSQDADFVVDKEEVSVFLGRLATSRLLLKVAIVDGTFDNNNKLSSLKVKEIYKQ